MKITRQIILAAILVLLFSSCGAYIEYAMRESRLQMPKVMQIKNGITKDDVITLMEMPPVNRQMSTAPNGSVHEALQWDLGLSRRATSNFPERDMLVVYLRDGLVTDIETYSDAHGQFMTIIWNEHPGFLEQ